MEPLQRVAPLVGRTLLALVYLLSGVGKIFNWEGTRQFMEFAGMPLIPLFLIGAIVLEVGGSLSVILGLRARFGALMLAVFTIPTTLIFHNFWAEGVDTQIQIAMFMKNLSMMGGCVLIMAYGPGAISLDARAGREAQAVA